MISTPHRCHRAARDRSRAKAEKAQETTEEVEFRKQQAMQEELKQMTRRNQVAMERSRRTAYSGNVRSSKPLTVGTVRTAYVCRRLCSIPRGPPGPNY